MCATNWKKMFGTKSLRVFQKSANFLKQVRKPNAGFASASTTQTNEEASIQFQTKIDGKRMSGAEYLEHVKSVLKIEEPDFTLPKAVLDSLLPEYDNLINESQDWKDKYQRSLAETENVRRRGTKQTEDAKMFAIQGFCKDLLEVADILDLAVNSIKPDELEKADKQLKDLYDGVSMTKTVMMKTFSKYGLVSVNPQGNKFDPNLHEAVFQIPSAQSPDVPVGHVMHVSKIGYSLNGRPIRAAQVGVVVE